MSDTKFFNLSDPLLNMSLSTARLSGIDLEDEALSYKDEAIRCYSVGCFRATVTMVWSVLIYHIYKKIDEFGLDEFARSARQRGISFKGKINDFYDLEKIKDNDIILVCREFGFFDDTLKKKLNNMCDDRNSCAHFNRSTVNQLTTDAFIAEACDHIEYLQKLNFKFEQDFFRDLKKMSEEGLRSTASGMGFERLKITFTKILDKFASVVNYKEYQENDYLEKFISNTFSVRKEDEIVILYDLIFNRVVLSSLPWGTEIKSIAMDLTNRSFIQSYILDNEYLDYLVSSLCSSGSYEEAAKNSIAVLNFNQYLTPGMVTDIANAILLNSQIKGSWTAKPTVKSILQLHKKTLSFEMIEKLKNQNVLD